MTRFRRGDAEDGSALIIALIFIAIWSFVILAVLTFAEAGFKLSVGSTAQRDQVYAADGAVEAAITRLSYRDWYEDGPPPEACDSYTFLIEPEADPEGDPPEPIVVEVEVTCRVVQPEANPWVVDLEARIERVVDGSPVMEPRLIARVAFDDGTETPAPDADICDPDAPPPDPPPNGDDNGDDNGNGNGDDEDEEEEEDECVDPPEPILPAEITLLHWQPIRVVTP
jgi:hypothetical protein